MSLDFSLVETQEVSVWEINITHNLALMADKAGLYKALWRPSENGFELARDIIESLERGITALKIDPDYFKKFNPKNGWGDYENLIASVEQVLKACKEYPEAKIRI